MGPPLLAGHTGVVTASKDGQHLASANEDGSITVWDVATGQPLAAPLLGHTDLVTSLVFSPDGAKLASSSLDKAIIVWDLLNHRQQGAPLVGHTDRVNAVAFSPDGLLLASGASNENSHHPDNRVILWDVGTQRPFGQILTDSQAPGRSNLAMTVTPAGKTLLTSVSPDGVMLWDKEAGSLGAALNDSRGPVALSSNGQWVATGNRAHGITVWDVASRQPRVQFSLEQDGNIATPPSTSEEGATARSVETGAALDSIAFSPDSTILASLTSDGRLDL